MQNHRPDLYYPTTTTSNEFYIENHKSTRRSLYNIMTALWLLPADKHDAQAMYKLHTCITYTWAILFTSNLQNKVMHRIAFYRFVCRVRNTRCYAHDIFGNHRSHLHCDHAKFSNLTDLIDHRESDSGLRFTVNPDGGWPAGRGRSCHDLIDPDW